MNHNYDAHASQAAPWKGVPRYDEALDLVAEEVSKEVPTRGRVLDVGTGGGEVIRRINQRRPDIIFDAYDLPGAHGISTPKVRCIEGDLETIVLPKRTYDAITASLSLHHLSSANREHAYKCLVESLKWKGMIAIFDVYETTAAEEQAFRQAYVSGATAKIGAEAAARRYETVVGPHARTMDHVPDHLKDQYPDRQIRFDEAMQLLRKAGISKTFGLIDSAQWNGRPEDGKMKVLFGYKNHTFSQRFLEFWSSGRRLMQP